MSAMHLHSPSVTNAGTFIDAGSDVSIGNGKTQIDADRATELVSSHRATRVATGGGPKRTVKPKAKRSKQNPVETANSPDEKSDGEAPVGDGSASNA